MVNETEREFRVNDWLKEGAEGINARRRNMMHGLIPKPFSNHMRAARREMLLAFRSLIDEAIERIDPDGKPRGKTIKVD